MDKHGSLSFMETMKLEIHNHIADNSYRDDDDDGLYAHLKKQILLLIADDNEVRLTTESLSSTTPNTMNGTGVFIPQVTNPIPKSKSKPKHKSTGVFIPQITDPVLSTPNPRGSYGVWIPRVTIPIPTPTPKHDSENPKKKQKVEGANKKS